jgi:hypothetical protein
MLTQLLFKWPGQLPVRDRDYQVVADAVWRLSFVEHYTRVVELDAVSVRGTPFAVF